MTNLLIPEQKWPKSLAQQGNHDTQNLCNQQVGGSSPSIICAALSCFCRVMPGQSVLIQISIIYCMIHMYVFLFLFYEYRCSMRTFIISGGAVIAVTWAISLWIFYIQVTLDTYGKICYDKYKKRERIPFPAAEPDRGFHVYDNRNCGNAAFLSAQDGPRHPRRMLRPAHR